MAPDEKMSFTEKKVDESWKEQVEQEKSRAETQSSVPPKKTSKLSATSQQFTQFITSLAVQTLIHLGEVENPITHQKSKDLDAAKEIIDLLIVLKDKTAGNCSAEEQKLFDHLLADLQLKFVQESQKQQASDKSND